MNKVILTIAMIISIALLLYAGEKTVNKDIQINQQQISKNMDEAVSQYQLGLVYYLGKELPLDYAEAVRLFRLAADAGLPEAQSALAKCYKNGEGVEQNPAEASRLYKLSATQNNAEAQFNLGVMHYAGEGVPVDFEEGAKYFKLSANQGYVEAMENLGFCYYEGSGVKMDVPESYFWLKLASAMCSEDKKEEYTKAMEIKRAELSQTQIQTIDKKVDDWINGHKK